MKKKFELLMVLCLFAASFFLARRGAYLVQSNQIEESPICIVIDAGHGENDPGKVGVNGALEKDINLSLALKLQKLFENKEIQVILTRDSDKTLAPETATNKKVADMQNRVALISESDAILTVSLHQNSYPDASVSGPQVFYYSQSKEGSLLALSVQESLNKILEPASPRATKANDNYYLLLKTPTPTIIVECGFLSNPQEADLLTDDVYQDKIVRAIYLGICDYLKAHDLLTD